MRILEKFKSAFKKSKTLQVLNGIEIHGAHTYLISQLNSRLGILEMMSMEEALKKECIFQED